MEVEFGVNLSSRAGAVADDAALAGAAEPSLSASVSGIPATRRLVPLTRLRVLAADPRPTGPADSAFDDVLAALTRYRIVTTGTTPSGAPPGEPAAELIHDTLIRDWTDLRDWVARDHDFQSWLQRARPSSRPATPAAVIRATSSTAPSSPKERNGRAGARSRRRSPRRAAQYLRDQDPAPACPAAKNVRR